MPIDKKMVYFVGGWHMNPVGYYKVGISANVKIRIHQIQTHSPFLILPIVVVKHKNAAWLEQAVLDEFKSNRIRGEWFYVLCESKKKVNETTGIFCDSVKKFMLENGGKEVEL